MLGRYFKPYQSYKVHCEFHLVVSSMAYRVFSTDTELDAFLTSSDLEPLFSDYKLYSFGRGSIVSGVELLDIFKDFSSVDLFALKSFLRSLTIIY